LLTEYVPVALLLVIGFSFGFIALIAAMLIRPFILGRKRKRNPIQLSTYECGLETIGPTWVQFRIGFYLYALLFVVFDVETVFLYPWAVAYRQMGLFALVEVVVFVAILLVGLAYAWKKGALVWK